MRPSPSDFIPSAYPPPPAALTTVRLPFQEPSMVSLDACDPRPCRWTPPASASRSPASPDFEANAILVMIVLLCTVICVLALHAALRCFLRGGGGGNSSSQLARPEHPITSSTSTEPDGKHSVIRSPPVAYSATMGIAGAECAICLTEFEEGIGVRVLRRCRHGFHTDCIEKWLSSHLSCPNCRGSCFPPAESSPCKHSPEHGEASAENRGGRGSIVSELVGGSD